MPGSIMLARPPYFSQPPCRAPIQYHTPPQFLPTPLEGQAEAPVPGPLGPNHYTLPPTSLGQWELAKTARPRRTKSSCLSRPSPRLVEPELSFFPSSTLYRSVVCLPLTPRILVQPIYSASPLYISLTFVFVPFYIAQNLTSPCINCFGRTRQTLAYYTCHVDSSLSCTIMQ